VVLFKQNLPNVPTTVEVILLIDETFEERRDRL